MIKDYFPLFCKMSSMTFSSQVSHHGSAFRLSICMSKLNWQSSLCITKASTGFSCQVIASSAILSQEFLCYCHCAFNAVINLSYSKSHVQRACLCCPVRIFEAFHTLVQMLNKRFPNCMAQLKFLLETYFNK